MKVNLPKPKGHELRVHLDAKGEVVSIDINVKTNVTGLPVSVVTRPLKGRSIGAVAGTLLSLSGGALKGAIARNKNMTAERRKEIAEKAAAARWGKPKKKK